MALSEMWLLVGILALFSLVSLYMGFRLARSTETVPERLEHFSGRPSALEGLELREPFFDRIVRPTLARMVRAASRLAPQRNVERLRRDLIVAGDPYGLTVADFLGIKVLAALLAAYLTFILPMPRKSLTPLFVLVLGIIGFYLPNIWLRLRISARKAEIARALPDALDMLTVCVHAGLSLDSAFQKISEKWQNALAQEFSRTLTEIRIGVSRHEALRNMASRADVPDVSNFVAVLIQADRLGLSIGKTLEAQAEQLRVLRRQRAEEKARQAPIKMLFPLVFLIFPALFAVILGPAIPALIESLSQLIR